MSYYDNDERRAEIADHIKKLRDIAGLYLDLPGKAAGALPDGGQLRIVQRG